VAQEERNLYDLGVVHTTEYLMAAAMILSYVLRCS
jgi:hypothetical protein